MSEWIEWNGGVCPVAPDTRVRVKLRDTKPSLEGVGEDFEWYHTNGPRDIVAYRVISKAAPTDTITSTLSERDKRYGVFTGHAEITQVLKDTMRGHSGWQRLVPDQREALEMVAHKIGRILNGDPNYDDSWVDIAGYAKLVADRLQGVQR